MDRKAKKYLYDILGAIESIEAYTENVLSLSEFDQDAKTRHAVENRIIVIGEAAYKLRRIGVSLPQADQLINRRNTFVHQYDSFSVEVVWKVIKNQIPQLKVEVSSLLEDNE